MNKILQVLLFLLGYQVFTSIIFFIGDLIVEKLQLMEWYYLLKLISSLITLAVLLMFFRQKNYLPKVQSKLNPIVILLIMSLGMTLKFFRNPLYHLKEIFGASIVSGEMHLTSVSHYSAYIISFIVLTPILEEFVFRGFVLRKLLSKYSDSFSILLSSILFALFHLNLFSLSTSYASVFSSFIFSLFASVIYLKSKNIWNTILLHSVGNLLTFLFNGLLLKEYVSVIRHFAFNYVYWLFVGIFMIISFVILRKLLHYFERYKN